MAVIVARQPATAKHSGINPVLWEFESEKQQDNGTKYSVSSVQDESGFVRFNLAQSNTTMETGDIITGSGFTDDKVNVRCKITSILGFNVIRTNIPWDSITTSTGDITLTNDNFKMRLQVLEGGTTNIIGEAWNRIDDNDLFLYDLSGILSSVLDSDLPEYGKSNTGTWVFQNGSFLYEVEVREYWDDVDYGVVAGSGLKVELINSAPIVAYNLAFQKTEEFSDFLLQSTDGSTRQFRTRNKRQFINLSKEEGFLHFISDEPNVEMVVIRYAGNTGQLLTYSNITVVSGNGYLPLNQNTLQQQSDTTRWEVYLRRAIDNVQISERIEILPVSRCYNTNSRLQWLNKLGGFDSYTFYERADQSNPDKQTYFDTSDIRTLTFEDEQKVELKGLLEANRILTWLKDLYSSDEVYLTQGIDTDNELERIAVEPGTYNTFSRENQIPDVKLRRDNEQLL